MASGVTRDAGVGAVVVVTYHDDLGVPGDHPARGVDETWASIRRAVPLFAGHRQPRVPGAGYYDPLDVELHERTFAVAARYGVTAFCYRLAGEPRVHGVERIRDREDLRVRYLVRWSVARAASGAGLGAQGERDDVTRLASYFDDVRYARLGGRPILVLDGATRADDARVVAADLRARCDQLGVVQPFIGLVERRSWSEDLPPEIDAFVESHDDALPPTAVIAGSDPDNPVSHAGGPQPSLGSYPRTMSRALARPMAAGPWIRRCQPGFDDTALRGPAGTVLVGDEPALFGAWLRRLLERTYLFGSPDRWLVFAGPWNAWARGSYLEPDVDDGDRRLVELREALRATDPLRHDVEEATAHGHDALLAVARCHVEGAASMARELLATWQRSTSQP